MVKEILDALRSYYKTPTLELKFDTPFQLLIAVILAAQTTDECVNKVTKELFKRFRSPSDFLDSNAEEDLIDIIKSINFYKKKAATIINCCKLLIDKYGDTIPKDVDELSKFSGIGRKTAAMVIANAYNIPAVFIDTHVNRVSLRLGITKSTKPEIQEEEIKKCINKEDWKDFCLLLIMHGKSLCHAKKPLCDNCPLKTYCNYYKREMSPI